MCVEIIILKHFSHYYVLRSHKITTLVANNISKQIWVEDRRVYESNLSTQNPIRRKLWSKI